MSEGDLQAEEVGQGEPTWVGTDVGRAEGSPAPVDSVVSSSDLVKLLEERLTEADSKRREAEQNVADRFREIAQLTRMLKVQEEASAESGRGVGIHGELVADRTVRFSDVMDEVQMLSRSKDSLQHDLRRTREEFERQAYKLATLRSRLQLIEGSRSWKFTAVFRAIAEKIRRLLGSGHGAKTDLEVIRDSPLFDGAWYLATNHDVKASGLDPAEHYLLYGGLEGRKASTRFDSERYLSIHHDVRAAGINPLLHYEMYGKAEGRPTSAHRSQADAPPERNIDVHEVRDATLHDSNDDAARARFTSSKSQPTSDVAPPPSLR